MTQRIDGILFDLGETLADFGRVDLEKLFLHGAQGAYAYLQQIGQPLPTFATYHRTQRRAVSLGVLKSRLTRREFNARHVIERMAEKFSQTLTPEQVDELAWLWYQPLSRQAVVEPGTAEMLRQFHDDGLTLGIISNTFVPAAALDRHLRSEGLLEMLPMRVYSCEVRYRKPSKAIFRIALQRAGLAPENTVFVGDSLFNDIWGANRMGMISVLRSSRPHRVCPVRPDYTIASLLELPDVLNGSRRNA